MDKDNKIRAELFLCLVYTNEFSYIKCAERGSLCTKIGIHKLIKAFYGVKA